MSAIHQFNGYRVMKGEFDIRKEDREKERKKERRKRKEEAWEERRGKIRTEGSHHTIEEEG